MWRSIKKLVLTLALIGCTASAANADVSSRSASNAGVSSASGTNAYVSLASAANAGVSSTKRYTFVEDGELSKQVHLPTCEWYPIKPRPDGMVLAIHGLTLHGRRYEVMGRFFAAENSLGSFYVVAPDMRGFGRNRDKLHTFCEGKDCKRKVDYPKSVDDMCKLAEIMHNKYPGVPLYLMGESLGGTMCLAVAAKRPDLFDGLVLSGVAETVNPLMFDQPGIVAAGLFAVFLDPKFNVRLGVFMKQLVSNEPDICQEMMNDPLVPKKMTLNELIKTDWFVGKTNRFASGVKTNLPILVLQGSEDKCVVPNAVANLAEHIHSSDQTMRWLYAHGHLLLETEYIRPATIDAITDWFDDRTETRQKELKALEHDLHKLGGKQLASEQTVKIETQIPAQ